MPHRHNPENELLVILKSVSANTGWNVKFLYEELPEKWGWTTPAGSEEPRAPSQQPQQVPPMRVQTYPQPSYGHSHSHSHSHSQSSIMTPPQQQHPPPPLQQNISPVVPRGRNPLAMADFSMPQHPYQSHYVAPNTTTTMSRHSSASYY